MSSNYKFIDHTADIAVEVISDTIEELFIASALALREIILEIVPGIDAGKYKVELESGTPESLLVNFLNELNFRMNSKGKIFNEINDMKINNDNGILKLECTLSEVEIDSDKIKTEIKSVTYHQMEIRNINGEYTTRIVFDI